MAKKLLSEAQMRRFAKLANLPAVNEMYHKRDEEEMKEGMHEDEEVKQEGMHEDEEMKEGMHEKEEEMKEAMHEDEPEAPAEMPEMEPEMDMDGGDEMELTDEEAQAIIDLADKLRAAMDDAPAEEPAMDAEEPEMPEMGDDMDKEDDELMEALSGIEYIPEQKDIVEEVARRVAKRLLKAKKANQALQEALSSKK